MTRIALGIEYNGHSYSGWQRQQQQCTVQACVESALTKVANHAVQVICAGRTDSGVHALNQVVHFDTTAVRSERSWIMGTNNYLPPDINIKWSRVVSPQFHARYSALTRSYEYWIYNHSIRSSLLHQQVAWYYRPLNAEVMHGAAQCLLGEHDFTSFRASHCQAHSARRHIKYIAVQRHQNLLQIEITANAFLYHMVRNIVGSLVQVGSGAATSDWLETILSAKDRCQAAATAPACGLYFSQVNYDPLFNIPSTRHTIQKLLQSLSETLD